MSVGPPPGRTDTVEAIVAEMRDRARITPTGCTSTGPVMKLLNSYADRLQSAHDAALREAARMQGAAMSDALSLLREAERDARRYRWLREHELTVSRHSLVLSDQSEKLDAAIDRAMEGEDG